MKQVIIINGPNLNLLGRRQPDLYGYIRFEDYFSDLELLFPQLNLHYYQSNHEGDIIDKLHLVGFDYDGIILNAGGYTHTSIAISDAITAITTPVVEVHITDIYKRESFRHINYIKNVALHSIVGLGLEGYREALTFLIDYISAKDLDI